MKRIYLLLVVAIISLQSFAYDFSAVCETGQTLYYQFCRVNNEEQTSVAVVCESGNPWGSGYNKYPSGDLVIPESVEYEGKSYTVKCIFYGAFQGCSKLASVHIPESVIEIGENAFYFCTKLASINIPNGIEVIPAGAFSSCSKLTNITLPETVMKIGNDAFSNCSSLTSINIPDGIEMIPGYAFYMCSSLTSIYIPESVTKIGDFAFLGCSNLTSINIPETVTEIGYHAFGSCSSLTSINIPDGVTTIGSDAFGGCSSLTSINIPDGVTTIGLDAFNGCSNLKYCVIKSQTPPEGTGSLTTSTVVYVPCGYLAAYLADENWNGYNLVETNYKVELQSSNEAQGTVSYEGSLCAADGKLNLVATPISTSQFVAWSDGNTENPRTVVIDKDTVFTAVFGDKPIITVTNTRMPVCDAYNGSITVSVSAGVEPYTYEWSDGDPAEENRSGLQSGIYTLKVTDKKW